MLYDVTIDGKNYRLELERAEGRWACRLDGHEVAVDAVLARPDVLSLRIGDQAYEIKSERVGNDWHVWVGSARFACEVRDPRALRSRARAADDHGPEWRLACSDALASLVDGQRHIMFFRMLR